MIINSNLSILNTKQQISFKEGKTFFYSDFDGTYMPKRYEDINYSPKSYNDGLKRKEFESTFKCFEDFFKTAKDKFDFIITTGRNKPGFDHILNKTQKMGLAFPLPEKLIVSDGGDIFKRVESNYSKSNINHLKLDEVEKMTNGWDGSKIQQDIKEIILNDLNQKNLFPLILHAPSNATAKEYGEDSLEYKVVHSNAKDKSTFVSFRDDGDLRFHIAFSPNIEIGSIEEKLNNYFKNLNIKAEVVVREKDYYAVAPIFENEKDYNLIATKAITIKPVITDFNDDKELVLTKLFDVKKAVKEIIDNDSHDLVIVAGNGDNDEEMLNIFNYVDLIGLEKPRKGKYNKCLNDSEYMNTLKSLPLVSIIVDDDPSLNNLRNLSKNLAAKGVNKIICVNEEKENLVDGIKKAMVNQSKNDKVYKFALGKELYTELLDNDTVLKK